MCQDGSVGLTMDLNGDPNMVATPICCGWVHAYPVNAHRHNIQGLVMETEKLFWLLVLYFCGFGCGAIMHRWISKFHNGDYCTNDKQQECKDVFPLSKVEINKNM